MLSYNYGLEGLLLNWAAWIIEIKSGNAGYPKKSITAAAAEGTGFRNNATSSYPIYDPKAEEIDYHYKWIEKHYPPYADAIYHFYISPEKVVTLAEKRGIAPRTFRERVQKARLKLQERIEQDRLEQNKKRVA